MHLFFWQNILSPHQAPFLRTLPDLGHRVTVVAAEAITADRQSLGWAVPDMGRARVVVSPSAAETTRLIEESPKESIHVMAGARWTQLGKQAHHCCRSSGRRMGIMSEAPDPRGLLCYARLARYILERRARGGHYDFVLAMGETGVGFFRRCGYPAQILFPFAYVTEVAPDARTKEPARTPILLYTGQFIARKGLDLLLRAFAAVPSDQAQLRLLGEGPEKQPLEDNARDLGIHNSVLWLPKTDSAGVQKEMAKADVTLLPSRHDGWGAVVNESLTVGTPVICSDACGAADVIRELWLGTIFRAGRVDDLANALAHWINRGSRSAAERERIRSWAHCISGPAVAEYFSTIIDHIYSKAVRPVAPWRMPLVAADV